MKENTPKFMWVCRCGEASSDLCFLSIRFREFIKCPGNDCGRFLSDYRRIEVQK